MSAGCAGAPKTGVNTGIRIDFVTEQDDSIARYRANPDGTLDFAGGLSVRKGGIDWSGAMTAEEVDSMRAMLQSPFWQQKRRDSGKLATGERRYNINIRTPQFRNRIIVHAHPHSPGSEPDEVAALHELLRNAAARRFDPVLRDLPQAGPLRR